MFTWCCGGRRTCVHVVLLRVKNLCSRGVVEGEELVFTWCC